MLICKNENCVFNDYGHTCSRDPKYETVTLNKEGKCENMCLDMRDLGEEDEM